MPGTRGAQAAGVAMGDGVEPDCPFWEMLDDDGDPHDMWILWDRTVAQLKVLGTLNSTDGAAIEAYCRALHIVEKLEAERLEGGFSFKSSEGRNGSQIKVHPDAGVLLRYRGLVFGYQKEFGLTPSARVRAGFKRKAGKDEFADDFEQ